MKRVFIASSNDLSNERKELELLLHREHFQPIVWEAIDHSITGKEFQSRINEEELLTSDIVIFMIKSKLGPYTQEEFNEAYENLGKKIEKIYVYFFKEDRNTIDDDELFKILSLQKFLRNEGKLYTPVNNFTDLKIHFLDQKKYINFQKLEENKKPEVKPIIEVTEKLKICIYTASPLNEPMNYKLGKIVKPFSKYNIELYHKILTEDELIDSYDFDAIYIFTKTNREKIIIEDEYFIKKSITIKDLEKNVDASKTFIFTNHEINMSNCNIFVTEEDKVHKILPSLLHKEYGHIKGHYQQHLLDTELPSLIDKKNLINFVGRRIDLENIIKKTLTVRDENQILTIKASGGIGKTTIISKATVELAKRGKFHDGIKFIQCEFLNDYESFENRITTAFDMNNALNFQVQLHEQELNDNRLIILDNIETLLHIPDTERIKELIKVISDYATIVITSREILNEEYEDIYELSPLTTDEAEILFTKLYKLENYDRKILRTDILENLLDNNPLAIKLVTKNLPKGKNLSILKESLDESFFDITSDEIEEIFKKESDTNIQRTKSLFQSINYSYEKLSSKEQLALETLSLFPDGLHLESFKKFYNKDIKNDEKNKKKIKHKIENFSDKDIKSLEDKSLIIINNQFINLQSIIGRFADFKFSKRDDKSKLNFFKRAYSYNQFFLEFLMYDNKYINAFYMKLFDENKNNFFKSLDYIQYLEFDNKMIDYLDTLITRSIMGNLFKEKNITQLIKLKKNYEKDKLISNYFESFILSVNYFNGEFEETFEKIKKDFPITSLITTDDNMLTKYTNLNIMDIYTMEGYCYESIKHDHLNNHLDLGTLSQLGMFRLSKAYSQSDRYRRRNDSFFYFEFLLNTNSLDINILEKYVKVLYKVQNLEKTQSTYTLLKADETKVKLKHIKKLIVVNPFTDGLKILMLAIKDKKNCSKKIFELAINKLYHIKYYHIEAILIYSKYLKDKNDDDYSLWLKKGLNLAKKHYYRYLLHQFICLETNEYIEYNEDNYPLPEELDFSKAIKKYKLDKKLIL